MEIFTIVFDLTWEEVENLPINEAAKLKAEIIQLFSTRPDESIFEKSFESEGYKFEIFDIQENWTFAKNVDLENLSKDFNNFPICLTILYYPKDLKYETKKAIELSNIIKKRPITELYGSWFFFFLYSTACAKLTGNYSILDLLTETTKILKISMEDPEKLHTLLRRISKKKLVKSGALIESSELFPTIESNNGNIS